MTWILITIIRLRSTIKVLRKKDPITQPRPILKEKTLHLRETNPSSVKFNRMMKKNSMIPKTTIILTTHRKKKL